MSNVDVIVNYIFYYRQINSTSDLEYQTALAASYMEEDYKKLKNLGSEIISHYVSSTALYEYSLC